MIKNVRADWAAYRERRTAMRQLDAALASYRTPGDISDLLATLDRAEGPDVEYMRHVLCRNLREYQLNAA